MQKETAGWQFLFLSLIVIVAIGFPKYFARASSAANVLSPYLYDFNNPGILEEAAYMTLSGSPYWWLNSGAYLKIQNGRGATNSESLAYSDPWRLLYFASNPVDTDNGFHPQNIFRLLSRSKWNNAREEAYFIVRRDNLSNSLNRNASNGLLLISRFLDGDNLYYAGVRVDGSAIIKKKKNGLYYTLAQTQNIYSGEKYDKIKNPSLLPKNKWIGLRGETKNLPNGKVEISLYLDKLWKGEWQLVAHAIDDAKNYGGEALIEAGFGGIRTDFMDVEFENFRLKNI